MSATDRPKSVKRIDALTPEQVGRMPEWRDKWIGIGLRTGPADRAKFEAAAAECYVLSGLTAPRRIVWVASPFALACRAPTLAYLTELSAQVDDQVHDQVDAQVDDQVHDQVHAQVGDQVRDQVRAQVGDQVHAQVRAQVGDQVHDQVDAQVDDQVHDQVHAQVGAHVRDQVRAQVGDQVHAQVRAQVGDQARTQVDAQVDAQVRAWVRAQVDAQVRAWVRAQVDAQVEDQVDAQVEDQVHAQVRAWVGAQVEDQVDAQVDAQVRAQVGELRNGIYRAIRERWAIHIGGQFWVGGWYWASPSYVSFFRDVCGLDLGKNVNPRAAAYQATAESACWWWPHREFVMACERPSWIDRDAQGRLHSESRQAIEWPDGWGLYRIHGVAVPGWVVTNPERITVATIDAEGNAEVRRIMIERMGAANFMRLSGAEVLHTDDVGTLYARSFADGSRTLVAHVANSTPEADGSRREFWLRVHPELRPLLGDGELGDPQKFTCRNAVASTYGLRGEEYWPEVET
jgi:hypothetical protein